MRIALLIPAVDEKAIMINLDQEPEIEKDFKIKAEDISRLKIKLILRRLRLKRNNFYNLILEEEIGIRYDQDTDENVPAFTGRISKIELPM